MNVNMSNFFVKHVTYIIQHYNPNKYWKYRYIVTNIYSKCPKIVKLVLLLYIKKCDAFNNASMGTDLNGGATFKTRPILPHGLNGIVIVHKASIGANCMIFQQVTIAGKNNKGPVIGDNVIIGAGAKIIGDVNIGDNCFIGANAVVTKSFPPNSVIGGVPAVLIKSR